MAVYAFDGSSWPTTQPGDIIQIPYRAEPYRLKIHLWHDRITLAGTPGPGGELPQIIGDGAQEMTTPGYFSDEVAHGAVLTVAPPTTHPYTAPPITGITLRQLDISMTNAGADGFNAADGSLQGWDEGAAGIALYWAAQVTVEDCVIHDAGNGIFGTGPYLGPTQVLQRIALRGNRFFDNGLEGNNHVHHTYIEADQVDYIKNSYGQLRDGAAGVALKDRSARARVLNNVIKGGSFLLDLVEPDEGAGYLCALPYFGTQVVVGNLLQNPTSARAAIFCGEDQEAGYCQKRLIFAYNTLQILANVDDMYYLYALQLNSGLNLLAANNIFHRQAWDDDHTPSQFHFLTIKGQDPITGTLGINWATNDMDPGDYTGPLDNFATGANPLFTDWTSDDFSLQPGSGARGIAQVPTATAYPLPRLQYQQGVWVKRPSWSNAGAVE